MSKKVGQRQASVGQTNGKAAERGERAIFTSFVTGHSSYMERNWARMQDWAATQRPDLHPAPVLTREAKDIVHRPTLTPEARRFFESLRGEDHANRD